ncbi:hypothetical protein CVT24_011691 [Panaeolus cyanescens]|uniref:Carboxylic ester hydrolase n=1 Tax=Panaeolus cyanescens TaxID=181874 RepID=A0A409YH49_9AGAR|nr:hypothetical protein CVT24_011691 [Panaeolus cyanescens]
MRAAVLYLFASFTAVLCTPVVRDLSSDPPTVTLDSATVTGTTEGSLQKFLGIPFAQPPVGDLRFRLPQPLPPYNGTINATSYGAMCPQQAAPFPIGLPDFLNFTDPLLRHIFQHNGTEKDDPPESEDCLTINVIKPANVSADAKLPVIAWIFGGGFERGSAQGYDEQGTYAVNRSIELGQPVIYVAMNYRVSAWGFLASQEVLNAGEGNAGLVDQRMALEWIQKYINFFGGDSTKVTLWGQSAGAISASLQMLPYGGNNTGLFRGAFMQSGAPIPVGNITGGQMYYDSLVSQTGCSGRDDTLACLRTVPLDNLKAAVNNTPNYFSYQACLRTHFPFYNLADGVFLQDNPQRLLQEGKFMTNVTIVTGNVDDEGTVFSLSSRNVTTDNEYEEYISTNFLPMANSETLEPLWDAYPSNIRDGSPFDTSVLNAITPQYKRISAFQGDAVFQAPRRWFLQHLSGNQKLWSYLSRRRKFTPVVGSYHGSDLEVHLLNDYLVWFAYNLDPNDPNNGSALNWPEYTVDSPVLYLFPREGDPELANDTYRAEPMRLLTNLSLEYPL